MKTNQENTRLLVGSVSTLRSIAKTIREKRMTYEIERIKFKNFNREFKGRNGIALRVEHHVYLALYQ